MTRKIFLSGIIFLGYKSHFPEVWGAHAPQPPPSSYLNILNMGKHILTCSVCQRYRSDVHFTALTALGYTILINDILELTFILFFL